jgi:hypothetical protein
LTRVKIRGIVWSEEADSDLRRKRRWRLVSPGPVIARFMFSGLEMRCWLREERGGKERRNGQEKPPVWPVSTERVHLPVA